MSAQPPVPPSGPSYLLFRAGGERYGVPVNQISAAARTRQIVALPGAPAGYAGLAFVRGEPVGVLDAARILSDGSRGTAAREGSAGGILVVLEGERHALLVDRIDSVEDFGGGEMDPAPAGRPMLLGSLPGPPGGDGPIHVVSVSAVLGEER